MGTTSHKTVGGRQKNSKQATRGSRLEIDTKRAELLIETIRHLKRQGPSVRVNDESGLVECFYRGNDDTRCAVGYWIPDELYTTIIEGQSLTDLLRREWLDDLVSAGFADLSSYLETEIRHHYPILRRLQQAHDYAASEDGKTFDMSVLRREAVNAANELGIDVRLVESEFA